MFRTAKPILVFIILLWNISAFSQKVGLLLGTFVSDRWYLDQRLFSERVEQLGGECIIEIAYEPSDQVARARKLIADGVNVLVVVPLDGNKAVEIAAIAKKAGVPLISYDRLILSNDISMYISYDSEKVGMLQAEYFLSLVPEGKYMLVNGPVSDHNAILLRNGQHQKLKDHIASGKITLVADHILESWSEIHSYEFASEYFASGKEVPDVILAANDALANGIIQAIPSHFQGKIKVCGQDADLNGIRNIITGFQTMTVYKPIRPLAYLAAETALDLANQKSVPAAGSMKKGKIEVKAFLLDPQIVDLQNYRETVVKDGHVSMSEAFRNIGKAFEAERNRIQVALLQKEKALENQRQTNERNTFLGIILFFLISVVALGYTISQKQNDNKLLNTQKTLIEVKNQELTTANDQLHVLNEKLMLQKEEISAQRDAIAEQKERLEEVNVIIASQKDEIQHQNDRLEKEVQKRTAELIQYIRQLEQYSFVTAHNLRAPVARIIGLCQLVKMEYSNSEDIRSIIEKLIFSSQELDLVFKELNAILDIRTFSMEIFSPVNLEEELRNTQSNLKYEIDQTNAIIESDFSEVPTIVSIKPYVKSILFNLISNAIKYRHLQRQPFIRVCAKKMEGRVLLTVSDNGLGINTDYLDKIFQLYKRFHFHVEGRGIGLFLVKTQVDSLGGNIEIESEVEKGTRIKIWLDPA
jgi:D-xylose transport system substrate-binding protein